LSNIEDERNNDVQTIDRSDHGFFVLHSHLLTVDDIQRLLESSGVTGFSPAASVDDALKASDAPVLVLVDAPAVALAVRLDAGEDPEGACTAWLAQAKDLLRSQRRARKRVTLADIGTLADADDPTWARLVERLSLPVPSADTHRTAMPVRKPSPASLTIAQALIAIDSERTDIADEILSSTLGAQTQLDQTTIMNALFEARRLSTEMARFKAAHETAQAELAVHKQEVGLLRESLSEQLTYVDHEKSQTEQAFEEIQTRATRAERELQEVSRHAAEADGAVAKLQAELAAAKTESEERNRELALLRESARLLNETLAEAARNDTQAAKRIESLENDLAVMHLQRSELDSLRRRLNSEQQQQALVRSILGKQILNDGDQQIKLQTMIEQADTAHAEKVLELENAAEWERDEFERDRNAMQAEAESLRNDLGQVRQSLEESRATAEAYSAELAKVYGSKSWRLTGPMRAARHRLGNDD